jgi:prevent-host-death family protein
MQVGSLTVTITTISARDFARDLATAKRAATKGPVFITDRGTPRFVLQTVADYYRSTTGRTEPSLLEAMQAIGGDPVEFEAPRMGGVINAATFDSEEH